MDKKIIIFLTLLFFLLLSFKPVLAQSGITRWLEEGIVYILKSVANGFIDFAFSLLKTVISEDFVGVKFTQNDLVDAGWIVMRNLGNIIIVIALIIIALATILDIKEYQAQKTIPILILVALLVNFSPVICGIFIDGSNIIMLNFLKAGFPEEMKTESLEAGLNIMPEVEEAVENEETLGQSLIFLLFAIIASFVILVYALIFLLRYIALWLLVIFSPLAFVLYILKITRNYFYQWANQFLQWTFIGVSMSIILFLTVTMLDTSQNILVQSNMGGTAYKLIAGALTPIVFLIAGLFASLQTGAVGASAITGFATKKVKQAGQWTGKKVAKKTGQAIEYSAREGATTVGTALRGESPFRSENREKTRQAAGHWMENMGVRRAGWTEEQTAKRLNLEQREKEMNHMSHDRINETIQRPGANRRDVLAGLNILAKRKHLGGGDYEDGFQDLMQQLRNNGTFDTYGFNPNQVYQARPDQAQDVFDAVEGQTPGQFRSRVQNEALESARVIQAMNGSQARAVVIRGSRSQANSLTRGVENNAEQIWQNLEWLNRPGADTRDQEAMERIIDVLDAVQQREAITRGASGADIDSGNN